MAATWGGCRKSVSGEREATRFGTDAVASRFEMQEPTFPVPPVRRMVLLWDDAIMGWATKCRLKVEVSAKGWWKSQRSFFY